MSMMKIMMKVMLIIIMTILTIMMMTKIIDDTNDGKKYDDHFE